MLTEKERVVLKAIGSKSLISANDLKKNVGNDAEYTLNKLIEKKFVSEVRPIGTICYVITTKGTKALSELEK